MQVLLLYLEGEGNEVGLADSADRSYGETHPRSRSIAHGLVGQVRWIITRWYVFIRARGAGLHVPNLELDFLCDTLGHPQQDCCCLPSGLGQRCNRTFRYRSLALPSIWHRLKGDNKRRKCKLALVILDQVGFGCGR